MGHSNSLNRFRPWPEGIIKDIGTDLICGIQSYVHLSADQEKGLDYAVEQLPDKTRQTLLMYYKDHLSCQIIGDRISTSRQYVQVVIRKGLEELSREHLLRFIRDGYQKTRRIVAQEKTICRSGDMEKTMRVLTKYELRDCGLRYDTCNGFIRAGYTTLADVARQITTEPHLLMEVPGVGRVSRQQVVEKLEEYGVDCQKARNLTGFVSTKKERRLELLRQSEGLGQHER